MLPLQLYYMTSVIFIQRQGSAAASWINVASSDAGAVCEASSVLWYGSSAFNCEGVMDGHLNPGYSWIPSFGEAESWLKLTLSFRSGFGHHDYSFLGWDDIPIEGIVSSFVRLDILSTYTENVEIRVLELEIFSGDDPCPPSFKYSFHALWCLYFNDSLSLDWMETDQFCVTKGGRMMAFPSQGKLDTILDWHGTIGDSNYWDKRFWTAAQLAPGQSIWTWPNGAPLNISLLSESPTVKFLYVDATMSLLYVSNDGSTRLHPLCEANMVERAILTTLLLSVVYIHGAASQDGGPPPSETLIECTELNIANCVGSYVEFFRGGGVIGDTFRTSKFCAIFRESLRCTHDLIAVCEDPSRIRSYEYYLYYALCPDTKYSEYLKHEACISTSSTLLAGLRDCGNNFFDIVQQDPVNACRYAQEFGHCSYNATLQSCGAEAAEWMLAVVSSMVEPTIPEVCPVVRPPPQILATAQDFMGPCHFPFLFEGRQYRQCISVSQGLQPPNWCSPTENLEASGEAQCIFPTTGGNGGGANCVFRFIYNGFTYDRCIVRTSVSEQPFCATTSNFDEDGMWGNCPRFDCPSRQCLNGGWCAGDGSATCVCTEQWTGRGCEIPVDACTQQNIDLCVTDLRYNELVSNASLGVHDFYDKTDVVDICSRYSEAKECLSSVLPACTAYASTQISQMILVYDHLCTSLTSGYFSHQQCLQEASDQTCYANIESMYSLKTDLYGTEDGRYFEDLCGLVDQFLTCQGSALTSCDDAAKQWRRGLSVRILDSVWHVTEICPTVNVTNLADIDGAFVHNYCENDVPENCSQCGSIDQCSTDLHHGCTPIREFGKKLRCHYGLTGGTLEDVCTQGAQTDLSWPHCRSIAQRSAGSPFNLPQLETLECSFFNSLYGCTKRQIDAQCGHRRAQDFVKLLIEQDTAVSYWKQGQCTLDTGAYECTAINIQTCLKDVSNLSWGATIAPHFEESEFVDMCRAYAVAKRCIGDLLSHCYLAERLRLIAFQYVADYICTDIEAGYLLHRDCFEAPSLVGETITCYDNFLGSISDDPMNLTTYYNNACTSVDTYLGCIRAALEPIDGCSEETIAWQTELSRRVLWVDFGMPNISCWGMDFSEIIGTGDIFQWFEEIRDNHFGCYSYEILPPECLPIPGKQDFCADLRTTGCKDNLHPDCFLETRFLQQVACFTAAVTMNYDIALDYTEVLTNASSQERIQLDSSLCISWTNVYEQLNVTNRGCRVTNVGRNQSTQITIKLNFEVHTVILIHDPFDPCVLLDTYSNLFDHQLAGNCVFSTYANYECEISTMLLGLVVARGLEGLTPLSLSTIGSDESRQYYACWCNGDFMSQCISRHGTVKPVYNDHLMGYFSAFWSSSRPRATQMSPRRFISRTLSAFWAEGQAICHDDALDFYWRYLQTYLCAISNDTECSYPRPTAPTMFCPAGHDHGQDSCMPCAKGFYKVDGGFHQCTVCPEGSTTANTGSTSLSHCRDQPCLAGLEPGPEGCVPCAYGFYKDHVGSYPCSPCPDGTNTTMRGSPSASDCQPEVPEPCLAGLEPGPEGCVPCAYGFYKDDVGSYPCSPCPDGTNTTMTGSPSASDCHPEVPEPCLAGVEPGPEGCVPCAYGFYKDDVGSYPCFACPNGTNTTMRGSSSASDCQPSDIPDACFNNPCGQNGICSSGADGNYACACDSDYYGDTCENRDYVYEESINIVSEVQTVQLEVKETVKRKGRRPVKVREINWEKAESTN